jgi:hypothetical protein
MGYQPKKIEHNDAKNGKDADELEDYLELQDPTVKEFIAESHKDYIAGHTRPAEELFAELKQQAPGTTKSRKRAKV